MNFLKGNILLGVNSAPATGGEYLQDTHRIFFDLTHPPLVSGSFASEIIKLKKIRDANDVENDSVNMNKIIKDGFVQRIKPLFFVPEDEVRSYAKKNNFDILYDKCPCAFGTYRVETRSWMKNITDDEKRKIVEGFQKIIPKLKKENSREIFTCKKCGEPCRGEICNACKIFSAVEGLGN